MTALTDQAIAKIKDLIMSGEFTAGSKLPNEQDLSQRLGLSRNSLREAVRALTLIGVLEPRVGDGTYVTSLEPELLLTGMGFVSDLLTGTTLLELHQVRRILEPVATEMAATRLDEDDLAALERCLADMDAAETTQAFIAADTEFHGIIVAASGNSTLASLIQNLSGGTLRARIWRSVIEQDAIEVTKRRHWDIYNALRDRDAERARAADLIHLSEGVRWLEQLIEAEEALAAHAVRRDRRRAPRRRHGAAHGPAVVGLRTGGSAPPAARWDQRRSAAARHRRARARGGLVRPGDVWNYPLPEVVWRESTLVATAVLLRGLHDATAGFEPPADARWMLAMPGDLPAEVVCHNDFAPYNVVFDDDGPVGVIDWETAAPGARVWDVAYAAYRWVPLSRSAPAELQAAQAQARRLRIFCDAYGVSAADRAVLLATVARRVAALRDLIVAEAASGDPVFAAHLADGHVREYDADLAYLRASAAALAESL